MTTTTTLAETKLYRGGKTRSNAILMPDADLERVIGWIENDQTSMRECARRLGIRDMVLVRRLSYRGVYVRRAAISRTKHADTLTSAVRKK